MKKTLQAALFSFAVLALAHPAVATDAAPVPDDAKALCLKAADYISAHGLAAARTAFDQQGEFYHGQLYAGVLDFKGHWLIYPPKPAAEGTNILGVRDSDGNYIAKEIVAVAENKGEGWVNYRFLNPAAHQIQPKVTYVKRVPGMNVLTYVGVYK